MRKRDLVSGSTDFEKCRRPIIGRLIVLLVSLVLAAFFTLGRKVHFDHNVWGTYQANYMDSFGLGDVFCFALAAAFFLLLFFFMEKYRAKIRALFIRPRPGRYSFGKVLAFSAIAMLLLWSPYLLSFAPDSVIGDSFMSIDQAYSTSDWSNHHPITYSMFIGAFLKAGQALGSINLGVLMYTLFQYFAMALAIGGFVAFMYCKRLRIWFLSLTLLFYGLTPVFPRYAITMVKDTLFSISLAALSFALYKLYKKEAWAGTKQCAVLFAATGLLSIFLRNNGLYIMAGLALLLLLFFFRRGKRAAAGILVSVLTGLLIQGPVYNALGVYKPAVEGLGIPVQQVAHVAVYDEEWLEPDERSDLDWLLPFEQYDELYKPCLVDILKFSEDFNRAYLQTHPEHFLKLWLRLLPKHLSSYVKAYCLETLGFWHVSLQNEYGYTDIFISDNEYGIYPTDMFAKISGFSIKEQLLSFNPLIGSGTLLWIMLISLAYTALLNKRGSLLFYLPALLCWGTIMVAAPVAFSLRYVFILMLLLPLNMAYPLMESE